MDSEVMRTLSGGKRCYLDNEKDLSKDRPSTYTATISGVNKVYSIFPGTVLFLGFYKGTGSLYISISKHEMVRYLNLDDIDVWKQSNVDKGTYLGAVKTNKPLQFEYCTVYKDESKYPVRYWDRTYYKQNPLDILKGTYWPYKEITIESGIIRPGNNYEFTSEQRKEWFSYEDLITGAANG